MNPAFSKKNVTPHLLVAIALIALAAILWTVADALMIAFGGIVLASVLLALALPLQRVTGLGPRWSLVIVILGLTIAAGLFCWLFGNEVAQQFTELQRQLPAALGQLQTWLSGSPAGRTVISSVKETGLSTEVITSAGTVVTALLGATGNLLLIVFLGIYFATDPVLYRDGAVRLVPVARRPQVRRVLAEAGEALRKWVAAQAIAMVAVGLLTGVALGVLGVPLALSLGVLAGLLEFVPVIGPVLSAVPGILLAFSEGPEMALYVAIVSIAVQQIESNVITPLVQRWAVKLPPVLGLLAIVAFGLLFGVLGVIFAMPLAIVTMVFVKRLYVLDTLEAKKNDEPGKGSSSAVRG